MIVLIIGHFSTFVKFCRNIKIPRNRANSTAQSKLHGPQKTVGPTDFFVFAMLSKVRVLLLCTMNTPLIFFCSIWQYMSDSIDCYD